MKKSFLAMALVATILGSYTTPTYAHKEDTTTTTNDQQKGEKDSGDGGGTTQDTTTLITESEVDFVHDASANSVTMSFADGTPFANAAVTVKNGTAGQDGDIEMNQQADADGVFDYSQWVDAGVAVLRVTVPDSSSTIEYNINTETMTVEAGKNKGSGDGTDGGGHTHVDVSATDTYMMAGGVVVVIAAGAAVSFSAQKKKKAAFEASQGGQKRKKNA